MRRKRHVSWCIMVGAHHTMTAQAEAQFMPMESWWLACDKIHQFLSKDSWKWRIQTSFLHQHDQNIKSTMIFQDFPLALFCFIILFGNMSFGESVSHARDLGDVKQRKMNVRILKHMTQPSYWPSSSASRKGTSSRSCAIDIIDMKSTKIKRWMLSMNLNNSQKVLLDPFKCLLNTCFPLVLSW